LLSGKPKAVSAATTVSMEMRPSQGPRTSSPRPPEEREGAVQADRIGLSQGSEFERSTAKGWIGFDGGCVEIREFDGDGAGRVVADREHFYIPQLLPPLKGDQKIRWHAPRDGRTHSVSQFGFHGPGTPLTIVHGPGKACFLICQINVPFFRKITGASRWPSEW